MCTEKNEEYISVGKLSATHGLKGELFLYHALGSKASIKKLKIIYIKEKTGHVIPWFIEALRQKNEETITVKLEGINNKEEAQTLLRKEVWLTRTDFDICVDKQSPVNFIGYNIIDQSKNIGEVKEVIKQPHQILCRLKIQGKEVFIPLHEASLEHIDHKKKEIHVTLPEGLLDIYLT